uniref:Chemoreceptor McpA-like n=1 Tax=Tanacetum cinerariifolium TaxID=118510 RepID=A0A699GHS6_TANCI|nr:chemoreceptor McpA-like [Tanacetum cinerariifolium]
MRSICPRPVAVRRRHAGRVWTGSCRSPPVRTRVARKPGPGDPARNRTAHRAPAAGRIRQRRRAARKRHGTGRRHCRGSRAGDSFQLFRGPQRRSAEKNGDPDRLRQFDLRQLGHCGGGPGDRRRWQGRGRLHRLYSGAGRGSRARVAVAGRAVVIHAGAIRRVCGADRVCRATGTGGNEFGVRSQRAHWHPGQAGARVDAGPGRAGVVLDRTRTGRRPPERRAPGAVVYRRLSCIAGLALAGLDSAGSAGASARCRQFFHHHVDGRARPWCRCPRCPARRRQARCSLVVAVALTAGIACAQQPLLVYGPGGPAPAMKEAAAAFEHANGTKVTVTAGPTPSWIDHAKQDADIIYSGRRGRARGSAPLRSCGERAARARNWTAPGDDAHQLAASAAGAEPSCSPYNGPAEQGAMFARWPPSGDAVHQLVASAAIAQRPHMLKWQTGATGLPLSSPPYRQHSPQTTLNLSFEKATSSNTPAPSSAAVHLHRSSTMKLTNIKIGPRLTIAFSFVLAMLLVVATLSMTRMAAIQQAMVVITKGNNVEASMASAMRLAVDDRMIALRNIVLLKDHGEMQVQVERIRQQATDYADANQKLRQTFEVYGIMPEESALLADIKVQADAAMPLMEKIQALALSNHNDEAARLLMHDLRQIQKKWQGALAALIASENRQNQEATVQADATYATARSLTIGISMLAILTGVAVACLITRSITIPINRAVDIARTVASGDLTSDIVVQGRDETAMLLSALKEMNVSLQQIVGQVRAGTETMTNAAGEIATGNLDLSSRTEQQAGALEETASSMEELTSTVKQNDDNARQANSLAASASELAGKGGVVIASVVQTMEAINDSSKKIVEIISVIDGIAFQTNILALNAAVEAARAGEQGRGFAVVATEVRNLAHRSAAAAKEIKALIDDSVAKVGTGATLVEEAGTTMSDVVDSVRRVRDMISEIAAASHEQSMGIEQVNHAIIEMDGVTQQNAALVEQSAAAAASMQQQAVDLADLVGKFVLPSTPAIVQSLRSAEQTVSARHRAANAGLRIAAA